MVSDRTLFESQESGKVIWAAASTILSLGQILGQEEKQHWPHNKLLHAQTKCELSG